MRSHISKSTALRICGSKSPSSSKQLRRISSELPWCGGLFSTSIRSTSHGPVGCQRSATTFPVSIITRVWQKATPTSGGASCIAVSWQRRKSRPHRSSPSRNATNGALAWASPPLRAAPEPELVMLTSRIRSSPAARARPTSGGARRGQPGGAGRPGPGVGHAHQPYPVVLRGPRADAVGGVVGAAVVDHDVLESALGLAPHGIDCLADPGTHVVGRGDDGDERRGGSHTGQPKGGTKREQSGHHYRHVRLTNRSIG